MADVMRPHRAQADPSPSARVRRRGCGGIERRRRRTGMRSRCRRRRRKGERVDSPLDGVPAESAGAGKGAGVAVQGGQGRAAGPVGAGDIPCPVWSSCWVRSRMRQLWAKLLWVLTALAREHGMVAENALRAYAVAYRRAAEVGWNQRSTQMNDGTPELTEAGGDQYTGTAGRLALIQAAIAAFCARSSADRALVFGTRCREFESLRAYLLPIWRSRTESATRCTVCGSRHCRRRRAVARAHRMTRAIRCARADI